MRFNAFIFARGGSKGLPRKNVLKIGGIPLVGHSIKHAKKLKNINNIYVSTDDNEIAQIAKDYGADVIKRPDYLSQDNSPELLAWKHAIKHVYENHGEFSGFISLPCTSPLRSLDDINRCIKKLNHKFDIVITMSDSKRSPWFNIVQEGENGSLFLLKKLDNQKISRRQDVPKTFDLTTVAYVAKTNFILNAESLWDGNVAGVLIPPHRSLDIDSKLDFEIAKFIYENLKF